MTGVWTTTSREWCSRRSSSCAARLPSSSERHSGSASRFGMEGTAATNCRDPVQLGPEHRDPAAVPVIADPDPGDVVWVAVDLPQALAGGDAGMLHPQRVQLRAVIDAAADLDAVGVHGPPGRGQQLDMIV